MVTTFSLPIQNTLGYGAKVLSLRYLMYHEGYMRYVFYIFKHRMTESTKFLKSYFVQLFSCTGLIKTVSSEKSPYISILCLWYNIEYKPSLRYKWSSQWERAMWHLALSPRCRSIGKVSENLFLEPLHRYTNLISETKTTFIYLKFLCFHSKLFFNFCYLWTITCMVRPRIHCTSFIIHDQNLAHSLNNSL